MPSNIFTQEVLISLVLDGFYGFAAGVLFTAIIRFRLWNPARVNVKQFRQPFHSSTGVFDRALVISCYFAFFTICMIFLVDIVDYFFLGLEYRLRTAHQQKERYYLHQDSYLLLMTHHITSIFLIAYTSLHGSSILAVYALVGLSCLHYSGIAEFLASTVDGITFKEIWRNYAVCNVLCYLATIWSMLARSKNWEDTGLRASKKATLMWMFTLHMLNLSCNTDLESLCLAWASFPIPAWAAKASVKLFLLATTCLSCYVFFTEERHQQQPTKQKRS